MKPIFYYIIRLAIFWMLLFFVQRSIFLFYFFTQTSFNLKEFLLSNAYSFAMDLATICYILLPVSFILIILSIKNINFIKRFCNTFIIILFIISNFILISDIGLFAEWGSKLNPKALSYLAYPKEVVASAKATPIFLLLFLFSIQIIPEIFIYRKFIRLNNSFTEQHWLKKLIFFSLFLPLLIIGIRGGIQIFPIDRSWSYFSEKPLLNQAAVNSTWNCLASLVEKEELSKNPYKYMDDSTSKLFFTQLTAATPLDSTSSVFKIAKPNIIIILLEGISGEAVGILNHEIDATPRISALSKEGLLFTNFYSTGFRTEQALAAIVAGFPSQPKTTVIRKFGKFDKMPSLAKDLVSNSYHTSYYYGGNLKFANTEAYLISSGFKKIIGEKDFKFKNFTNWGCFDEELFDFTVKDMSKNPQPFFSIVMTSTSHEPFDKRVKKVFTGNTIKDDYLNVVHYTDESVYQFIEKAKKEKWYQNTIFLIVSDHTHRLPKDRQLYDIERHWIPCLMYGPALKDEFRGKTIDKYTTHVDIPAILLAQLKLQYNKFEWSKNVFNKLENGWAFYTFDEGFGFLNDKSKIIFDHKLNKVIYNDKKNNDIISDSLAIKEGKALMQKLMNDYMNLSN
ncbi:MAG: sulfatase-like hydrolase/transferase [Bacteroidetes bacterium]|nr:sulfatase-like hydrolase/transferase [Bacteroidota bacterium]